MAKRRVTLLAASLAAALALLGMVLANGAIHTLSAQTLAAQDPGVVSPSDLAPIGDISTVPGDLDRVESRQPGLPKTNVGIHGLDTTPVLSFLPPVLAFGLLCVVLGIVVQSVRSSVRRSSEREFGQP